MRSWKPASCWIGWRPKAKRSPGLEAHASPGDGSGERDRAGHLSAPGARCPGGGKKAQMAAVDSDPPPGSTARRRAAQAGRRGAAAARRHGDGRCAGRVVDEAVERFGGLDGLVSNAGVNRPGPLAQYSVEDWDRIFAVNTRATWLLAKAAHDALKAAGGAIVAIGSMSGSNAAREPRRLRSQQGRCHHAGPGAGPGVRPRRHPGERGVARHGAHGDDRGRSTPTPVWPASVTRSSHSGAWPRPRTWRT